MVGREVGETANFGNLLNGRSICRWPRLA